MSGKFCVNHIDRDATARCLACLKMLCDECVVTVDGQNFCSKECANTHHINEAHMQGIETRNRQRARKAFVVKLIVILILAAGIYGGWRYYQSMQKSDQEKISDGVKDGLDGVKKLID